MLPERRRQVLLASLGIVLLAVVAYQFWPRAAVPGQATSNQRNAASRTRNEAPITAPDVHLEALNAERPKPEDGNRNLFRFKPRPAPTAPPSSPSNARPGPPVPSGPPPPPSLPPIPFKFSAILEQGAVKIAVLADTMGHLIYAKEGETVEGRYKVWRIGVESIEMSYLDGRGRQTIRLSGS